MSLVLSGASRLSFTKLVKLRKRLIAAQTVTERKLYNYHFLSLKRSFHSRRSNVLFSSFLPSKSTLMKMACFRFKSFFVLQSVLFESNVNKGGLVVLFTWTICRTNWREVNLKFMNEIFLIKKMNQTFFFILERMKSSDALLSMKRLNIQFEQN